MSSRRVGLLMGALGVALSIAGVSVIGQFLPRRVFGNDFSMAYLGGRLLQQGRDPYLVESLNSVNSELDLPFRDKMGRATNSPVMLWGFRWLSGFEPVAAFWIWAVVQAASLAAILATAASLIGRRLSWLAWTWAVGLTVCSMPVFANFWFGQVQPLIGALLMAGVWLCHRQRGVLAALTLTLAFALKVYPWPMLVLPMLDVSGSERYRRAAWTLAWLLFWAVLPGWTLWVSFFRHATPTFVEMASGAYYNFTLTSILSGWVGAETGRIVGTIVSLALVAAAWTFSLRAGTAAGESSACVLLVSTVLCSAVAWTHYLVLLIYPMICLAADAGKSRRGAMVIMVAGLSAFNLAGTNPWPGVRWLGVALPVVVMAAMWAYFLRRLAGTRSSPAHSASVCSSVR